MGETDVSYHEVLRIADRLRDEAELRPVEVRAEEKEQTRHRTAGKRRTRTAWRYFVVSHRDEEVLRAGRWTTGDQHNPKEAARARAVGFAAGYRAREGDE